MLWSVQALLQAVCPQIFRTKPKNNTEADSSWLMPTKEFTGAMFHKHHTNYAICNVNTVQHTA